VANIQDSMHPDYGKRLFGLFGGTGSYMEHPVPADTPGWPSFTPQAENPSLADCADAAIEVLELRGGGNGFFLMVEGGDIDWANHANDYSHMIGALYRFEQAVQRVVAQVNDTTNDLSWSNTLVIVTSDHANSYMRLSRDPAKILGAGDLPTQNAGPTYPDGEVWYGTTGHTNEPVMAYARGKGADMFREYEGAWYPGTRLIDNTHIYLVMSRAIGVN
jgi:alkaline phosphatase